MELLPWYNIVMDTDLHSLLPPQSPLVSHLPLKSHSLPSNMSHMLTTQIGLPCGHIPHTTNTCPGVRMWLHVVTHNPDVLVAAFPDNQDVVMLS